MGSPKSWDKLKQTTWLFMTRTGKSLTTLEGVVQSLRNLSPMWITMGGITIILMGGKKHRQGIHGQVTRQHTRRFCMKTVTLMIQICGGKKGEIQRKKNMSQSKMIQSIARRWLPITLSFMSLCARLILTENQATRCGLSEPKILMCWGTYTKYLLGQKAQKWLVPLTRRVSIILSKFMAQRRRSWKSPCIESWELIGMGAGA